LFRSRVLDWVDARGRNDGAVLRHDTVVDLVRGPSAALRGVAVASGEIVEGDAVAIAKGPWSILAARWLPAMRGPRGQTRRNVRVQIDTGAV
jgi:hypothetical protein